jgi:prepilin-type N-terminal cleavage/methylation domain-containing protein
LIPCLHHCLINFNFSLYVADKTSQGHLNQGFTMSTPQTYRGVTLAEILVALLVLSIMATFTFSKILWTGMERQKKAVLQETMSSVQAAIFQGRLDGSIRQDTDFQTYLFDHLSPVQVCSSDATIEGCWLLIGAETDHAPGMVLANGVSVVDFDGLYTGALLTLDIDYNGAAGPNTFGEDRTSFLCNVTSGFAYGVRPYTCDDETGLTF